MSRTSLFPCADCDTMIESKDGWVDAKSAVLTEVGMVCIQCAHVRQVMRGIARVGVEARKPALTPMPSSGIRLTQ